jgi:hypothetical protein
MKTRLLVLGALSWWIFGVEEEPPPEPVVEVAPEPPPPPPPPPPPRLFTDTLPLAVTEVPEGLPTLSAQGCAACHADLHGQWSASGHKSGFADKRFMEEWRAQGSSPICISCHLPLRHQQPNLAVSYIEGDHRRPELEPNPSWDPTLMADGVGCASCHIREGQVLGLHESQDSPHPIRATEELRSSALCANCHQYQLPNDDQPLYDTYGEWKRSAYSAAGVECQSCHMSPEAVADGISSFLSRASHDMHIPVSRAITPIVELDGSVIQRGESFSVRVRFLNTGAGHSVPTGGPWKEYRAQLQLFDLGGKELIESPTMRFGAPVEGDEPSPDTRIQAGKEQIWETALEVSQKKKSGTVNLRLSILDEDEKAHPIWEVPIELR